MKVSEYVERVERRAARKAGEVELVEAFPSRVRRALDLGRGDGRLLALVLGARPEVVEPVGLDSSPPMLDRAQSGSRRTSGWQFCTTTSRSAFQLSGASN